ncbi:WxL domain-containing protein [Lactococcus lactis]|uniref:WxL domain-containing protein n=1 Tax=Lactococcus lactis TaxID=1358 RepID=UPI00223A9FD2|nr:WxL domain-containing protein [Lactococcus lactis]MCT0449068.1 hypothetical protein [Lactococcus lactis subsp. lactis]
MKKYFVVIVIILSSLCFPHEVKGQDFLVPSSDYSVDDKEVTSYPYSSIVYIFKYWEDGGKSRGSGVVIGKDYVLTAGHVNNNWVSVSIIPGLKSNNTAPYGYWSGNRDSSITSPEYKGGYSANDYAVIKVNPRKNSDGSYTHIGDIVKPLTIIPGASNSSYFVGSNLAVLGYPSFSKHNQYFSNFTVTQIKRDYGTYGNLKSSGGMSGAPMLNNMAQVLGTYHGGGQVSAMSNHKVYDYLLPWGLNQEKSRVYLCNDKAEWEIKRKKINPEGNYIEKNNGETISKEELKKLSGIREGYTIETLTDGIRDYNVTDEFNMYIGGLTLYPKKAIANSYEILFSANGGEGQMSSLNMSYDKEKIVPQNSFKKTGYLFMGWNTQADGKGRSYSENSLLKNLTSVNNDKITLYAQWVLDSGLKSNKPNWVQVTDKRGTNAGWKLQVQQGAQFFTIKDGVYKELKGAQITINNGTVATTTDNKATAPTTSNKIVLIPGIINHPGPAQDVMIAQKNQGMGTWVDSFGSATTGDKSIALTVPGVSEKIKGARYSTELTWLLNDTPT